MILNLPSEAKWYLNDGSDCSSSVAIDKSQVYHCAFMSLLLLHYLYQKHMFAILWE